jgi:hypothetical protein
VWIAALIGPLAMWRWPGGTSAAPITLTSSNSAAPWAELPHSLAQAAAPRGRVARRYVACALVLLLFTARWW